MLGARAIQLDGVLQTPEDEAKAANAIAKAAREAKKAEQDKVVAVKRQVAMRLVLQAQAMDVGAMFTASTPRWQVLAHQLR